MILILSDSWYDTGKKNRWTGGPARKMSVSLSHSYEAAERASASVAASGAMTLTFLVKLDETSRCHPRVQSSYSTLAINLRLWVPSSLYPYPEHSVSIPSQASRVLSRTRPPGQLPLPSTRFKRPTPLHTWSPNPRNGRIDSSLDIMFVWEAQDTDLVRTREQDTREEWAAALGRWRQGREFRARLRGVSWGS